MDIKGVGTITVNLQGNIKKIGNVLLVLGLKMNLFSVSKLSKKKLRINFDEEGNCYILDMKNNGNVIAKGIRSNDLYRLLSDPIIPNMDGKACTAVNPDVNN